MSFRFRNALTSGICIILMLFAITGCGAGKQTDASAEEAINVNNDGLSEEIAQAYYDDLYEVVNTYGFCKTPQDYPGLAYAELIDFDDDGTSELYYYYTSSLDTAGQGYSQYEGIVHEVVCGWNEKENKLEKIERQFSIGESLYEKYIQRAFVESDGKHYLIYSEYDNQNGSEKIICETFDSGKFVEVNAEELPVSFHYGDEGALIQVYNYYIDGAAHDIGLDYECNETEEMLNHLHETGNVEGEIDLGTDFEAEELSFIGKSFSDVINRYGEDYEVYYNDYPEPGFIIYYDNPSIGFADKNLIYEWIVEYDGEFDLSTEVDSIYVYDDEPIAYGFLGGCTYDKFLGSLSKLGIDEDEAGAEYLFEGSHFENTFMSVFDYGAYHFVYEWYPTEENSMGVFNLPETSSTTKVTRRQ